MPTDPHLRAAALTLSALLLTACGSTPSQPISRADSALELPLQWQEPVNESPLPEATPLLALIDYPPLTALIDQTLAANYDLRQTALRLKEQRLLQRQTDTQALPSLDLNLNSQNAKNSNSSHTLSLDLSWELDIWGRLADQSRAAQASTDAQTLDYTAARNSLAARTVQQWLDIQLRAQIIRTEQQWLHSLEDTEAIISERYRTGLSGSNALADLETARADTALIRVSLAARQQQQRSALRQLAALQGSASPTTSSPSEQIPTIELPPVQLPATVLAQRPDIRAALLRVAAADTQAIASHKQLLPAFTLTSSLSQNRPRLDELLSGSVAWSLLGQLTAPLFDGGRLKADAEIADLSAARSYLAYQQTLLSALNEVEDALGQESSLAEQQHQLERALHHAEASLQHYQARYQDGLNDILDLLNARRSAFSTRIQLLQTQQARLSNRITLGLALGMGV